MTKLLLLSLTFCGIAAAQTTTTYVMPAGNNCPSIEGCYYHDLTAKAADGSTVWGFFEAGGYWTQFQYQAFEGQNPGYKALFCNGTATWTTAAMDSGNTLYTMDCQASPDRTSGDPPAKIHAEIEAHSYVFTYVCGVKVRTKCHQTRWAVDAGTLAITN